MPEFTIVNTSPVAPSAEVRSTASAAVCASLPATSFFFSVINAPSATPPAYVDTVWLVEDHGSAPSLTPVAVLRNSVGIPPVAFFALILKYTYSAWLSARPVESNVTSKRPAVNSICTIRPGAASYPGLPPPRSVRMLALSAVVSNSQFGSATSTTVTTPWSPFGK